MRWARCSPAGARRPTTTTTETSTSPSASIGGQLALLENRGAGGHWLEVQLDGFHPGAEVTVVLPDGRRLRREVQAGSSYLSSEDPRCHFGLGAADEVSELMVRWPGGGETRMTDVEADQLVKVAAPL